MEHNRGNHPVLRLLKNYHDTTICRVVANLIDYRLCTQGTFSAVSFSGGFLKQHRQCLNRTDSLAVKRGRGQPLRSFLSFDDHFQRLQPRSTHRLTGLANVPAAFPEDYHHHNAEHAHQCDVRRR